MNMCRNIVDKPATAAARILSLRLVINDGDDGRSPETVRPNVIIIIIMIGLDGVSHMWYHTVQNQLASCVSSVVALCHNLRDSTSRGEDDYYIDSFN